MKKSTPKLLPRGIPILVAVLFASFSISGCGKQEDELSHASVIDPAEVAKPPPGATVPADSEPVAPASTASGAANGSNDTELTIEELAIAVKTYSTERIHSELTKESNILADLITQSVEGNTKSKEYQESKKRNDGRMGILLSEYESRFK